MKAVRTGLAVLVFALTFSQSTLIYAQDEEPADFEIQIPQEPVDLPEFYVEPEVVDLPEDLPVEEANVASVDSPDTSGYNATLWTVERNIGIGTKNPGAMLEVSGGALRVARQGDGATLLELVTERSWAIRQFGTGSHTALEFASVGGSRNKNMVVTTQGALILNGSWLRVSRQGDGEPLLELLSERSWMFRQLGTGAGTALELASIGGGGNKNFIINTIGRVGIGTTKPSAKLHIMGDAPADANSAQFAISSSDGHSMLLGRAASYGFVQSHNRDPLALNPLGNNVGIGTTAPQARLDVAGTTRTDILQIDNGGDLAEPFNVAGTDTVEPGMVVAIDPEHPGQLRIADNAYDHTVAGVVSGAGDIQPGLILQQEGTLADGEHPVALSGRVYVWADASNGAIVPGDLLTTSDTPGHAMKAADLEQAQGAILGKAMTELQSGTGLVLILVTLQ